MRLLFVLAAASIAWPQAVSTFHGRKAWRIENDKIRVTALPGGGHIAELVLKNQPGGREVNPLWVPPWPSIEPQAYSREKHGKTYGTDSEAQTLSGLMGHNVCFDYWGAPSPAEFQAGLSYHGEASIIEWKKVSGSASELTYRADLPQSRTSLTRTVRLRPGQPVVYFDETAANHTAFDKPFGWVQHVTFGPPFVDARYSVFNAPGTRAERRLGGRTEEFTWPKTGTRDFRRFSSDERSADMALVLLDPKRDVAYASGLNTGHRQLVVYVFKRSDYPWLNVWEQNRSLTKPPWNGETRTRGMEFGNTRIPGTVRAWMRTPLLWDTPTFGWLDARGKTTVRYLAVITPIPEGFDELRDVLIAGDELFLVGPRDSLTVKIRFDPSLF